MTLELSQKEIDAWQQFVYDTTPGVEKPTAAAPVTINITFAPVTYNIVQTAISNGNTMPAPQIRIVEDELTKYLPSMYQSGNMAKTAERIAANANYAHTPLTKEERAALGDSAGYNF